LEALKSNTSVPGNTLFCRIDPELDLMPRRRLSGLRFAPPQLEASRKTEVDLTQTIAESLAQFLDSRAIRIEFQNNKTTGKILAQIIENQSERVVREGPVIFTERKETAGKGVGRGGFKAKQPSF
jgi:hypothetical protein